jgi:periplasmic copper chaperone A
MRTRVIGAALAAAALAPAGAQAHVTLHPNALPKGAFARVAIRVPNEEADAATTKVDLKFPSGFPFVSTQRVPGWKARVVYARLPKPVTMFGEKITQHVDRVVLAATGRGIQPGEFTEFPLSVAVPEAASGYLKFKALQTYSNGKVVRWIGTPEADTPAPRISIQDKDAPIMDYAQTPPPGSVRAAAPDPPATNGNDANGLAWAALIVALLGTAVGGAALLTRRRAVTS